MIERTNRALQLKVLIVDDELNDLTAWGRASRAMVEELEAQRVQVVQALSPEDGRAVFTSDAGINAVALDWSFRDDDPVTHERARSLLELVRARNAKIPVFLMTERDEVGTI